MASKRKRKPIVQSPAKQAESQEDQTTQEETPVIAKSSGKPEFWKNPVFLNGRQLNGLVTPETKAEYIADVKMRMSPEEFKVWSIKPKLSDKNEEADRRSKAVAKQRKKLGLD